METGPSQRPLSFRPLSLRWYECAWIALFVAAILVFLPIVIHRTCVKGFGDAQVFFRAGWAVWSGFPLYQVADDHSWTYHYPPTFAFLMGFFADPMPGFPKPVWSLSCRNSVLVWYTIGIAAVMLAQHVWANAVSRALGPINQGRWNGWWLLRLGPLLALLLFVGDGLGRGQPTAILLLLMVTFLAMYVAGRTHVAAVVLAAAITIKIFPVVLLALPLLRRDWMMLAAVAGYSIVLLLLVPALLVGPSATADLYVQMWSGHLLSIVSYTPNPQIAAEVNFTSYDMTSVGAMLTRIAANGLPQSVTLPGWAIASQYFANVAIVMALVWGGHGRFWRLTSGQPPLSYSALVAGAVVIAALPVMLLVSQPNYVAFALPLVAIAQVEAWRRDGMVGPSWWLVGWSLLMWLGMIATEVEIVRPLRVIGLVTPATIGLVIWGFAVLNRARVEAAAR